MIGDRDKRQRDLWERAWRAGRREASNGAATNYRKSGRGLKGRSFGHDETGMARFLNSQICHGRYGVKLVEKREEKRCTKHEERDRKEYSAAQHTKRKEDTDRKRRQEAS